MAAMLSRRPAGGLGRVGSLFLLRYGAVGLGILTSILWTRCAPMEVYGRYQMVLALLTFVSGFCLQGMGSSMAVAAAKGYDGNLAPVLRTKLLAGVAGAVAVAGVAFHWRADSPELFWPTLVGAALFAPWIMAATTYSWLNARGLTERLFAAQFVLSAAQLACLGAALWAGASSPAALLACIVAPQALLAVALAAGILRQRSNTTRDAASIRFGWHTSVAPLATGLLATDKLLLGDSLGPEDVAVYAVALVFPQQFNTIFSIVNQMLTPDMYKADSVAGAWAAIKPRLPGIGAAFVAIGLVGFAAFPVLIPLLFSAKYVAAVPYGKWLWLSLSVLAPLTLLSNILKAQQKTGFVYFMGAFQPLLQFGLYVALLGHGILGLVVARFAMQVIVGLAYLLSFVYLLGRERRMAATREASGPQGPQEGGR